MRYLIAIALATACASTSALSATDQGVCQTIATEFDIDPALTRFAVPMRAANDLERMQWNETSSCIGFPSELNGFYQHPKTSNPLWSVTVQTGMRASYEEILTAPPDCASKDWQLNYGQALFSHNTEKGSKATLLMVSNQPIFVIGSLEKAKHSESLLEAISIADNEPVKVCSFTRSGESIVGESGDAQLCSLYRNQQFGVGVVERSGKYAKRELNAPGKIRFSKGRVDELSLEINYTSFDDTYPILSLDIQSTAFDEGTLSQWEKVLAKRLGYGSGHNISEWVLLGGRPVAIERKPTEIEIFQPDIDIKSCQLTLRPHYLPGEAKAYGGAELKTTVGP